MTAPKASRSIEHQRALALLSFVDTIEVTGGLWRYADESTSPKADMDWIDLADAYMTACSALGRKPMIEDWPHDV